MFEGCITQQKSSAESSFLVILDIKHFITKILFSEGKWTQLYVQLQLM